MSDEIKHRLTANDVSDLKRENEYKDSLINSPNMIRCYEVDYAGASVGIVKANPTNVLERAILLCRGSHFLPQTFDPAKVNYSDKNGWRYIHFV
jgi:hypothetical protein